jgi:regulator of nucleoside diphosphate kinase
MMTMTSSEDSRTMTVTEQDHRRLSELVALYARREPAAVGALVQDLARAVVVPNRDVEGSIVTMKSRLTCRIDGGDCREIELVYPGQADAARGRISVLAPLGRALLGAAIGDEVKVEAGATRRTWRIEEVHYQPEAAGDHDL